MATQSLTECTCSPGPAICAACGGLLGSADLTTILFSKIEDENVEWLVELESQSRLNSTLATFRVIDRQNRANASFETTVSQAIKEIGSGIAEIKKEVVGDIIDRFTQMQVQTQSEATQLRAIVREVATEQVQHIMDQVKILQEEGKSAAEIHVLLREAVGSMQTIMTAFQVPSIRGEEGELVSIKSLQDAFFGVPGVSVESLGGPDATDAIVTLYQNEVQVGRSLIEIKSRKTWNSAFLGQVQSDMERYNAPMAVIVADKLPRNARGKGFAIDSQVGLIVIVTQDLLVPAVVMFHEIYALTFKMQKKALDLESIVTNKDLVFHINDNMNILDDCKRISDVADDSAKKIKEHVVKISSRLQENNRKIAGLLSKFSPNEA